MAKKLFRIDEQHPVIDPHRVTSNGCHTRCPRRHAATNVEAAMVMRAQDLMANQFAFGQRGLAVAADVVGDEVFAVTRNYQQRPVARQFDPLHGGWREPRDGNEGDARHVEVSMD